jgi:hypothetical protein
MRIPLILLLSSTFASASIYNLKIVTDANPDYSDLPSLVHSATSKWKTPEEKCLAMFYWNHIARRQTEPMNLHGMALTDPIRQFNDYGYTMCSTISGINQSIWEQMGLQHRYWDISNHTVSEVFYDGRWHMYDNSLSALYTLCDGKTLASVEDIGKEGACEKSGGKTEPGHIAKYHCLTSTSPNGFLTGSDTARSLDEEYRCFNPNGLKLRTYFYDWDNGHRYILNLRPGESYTRHYHSLGDKTGFFVPNTNGKDPESVNPRYRLRGNGEWIYRPDLRELQANGAAIFRINSANVMTSMQIEGDSIKCSISPDGRYWTRVDPAKIDQVNGLYQVLLKAEAKPGAVKDLLIRTITELNAKTQPRLNLGKNTIYVAAGDQSESIVLWPELAGEKYKQMIVEEKNVTSTKKHNGYQGTLYPNKAKEDGYVVYRIDAPRDLTRLTYGGRFYNRAPRSRIELLHSLDDGKTWTKSWSLRDTAQPWDVIHYETIAIPQGHKSVLVKYLMSSPVASHDACSIYALRIEANYQPAEAPDDHPALEVTFNWKEGTQERSHTQLIDKLPFKYVINVGGEDHPVMDSLTVNLKGARDDVKYGYSDGKDVGGERFVGTWQTLGKNLAVGKKYTLSRPSINTWEAGDPEGVKLTDGVAGPTYVGGISYRYGALWQPRTNPTITLDLGEKQTCASFGLNFHGYPWHDSLKGEIKDRVAIQISDDGRDFTSIGTLKTDLKRKEIPVNFMLPDEETLSGHTFRLIPEKPVSTRYVRYLVNSDRHFCATELEVLDSFELKPFDLRVALPDEHP